MAYLLGCSKPHPRVPGYITAVGRFFNALFNSSVLYIISVLMCMFFAKYLSSFNLYFSPYFFFLYTKPKLCKRILKTDLVVYQIIFIFDWYWKKPFCIFVFFFLLKTSIFFWIYVRERSFRKVYQRCKESERTRL